MRSWHKMRSDQKRHTGPFYGRRDRPTWLGELRQSTHMYRMVIPARMQGRWFGVFVSGLTSAGSASPLRPASSVAPAFSVLLAHSFLQLGRPLVFTHLCSASHLITASDGDRHKISWANLGSQIPLLVLLLWLEPTLCILARLSSCHTMLTMAWISSFTIAASLNQCLLGHGLSPCPVPLEQLNLTPAFKDENQKA